MIKAGQGLLIISPLVLLLLACQSNPNYLQKLEQQLVQIANQVGPSVVSITAVDSKTGEKRMGGGVSIEANTILTTEAVIGDASQVTVMLQNGEKIDTSQIEMVCSDYETNICLLKLRRNDLKPVVCREGEVANGSIGILVGNSPYTKGLDVLYGTMASSWIGGDDPYDQPLLALHALLGENSGGMPVFNHQGQLIGIIEGIIQGEEDVALILPASTCKKVFYAMQESHGKIKRGWIGVFVGRACPLGTVGEGVERENIKPNMIAQLASNSLAGKAGLKPGDIILSCQGKEISNSRELRQIVSMQAPGSQLEVVALRNGEKLTAKVDVGEAPLHESLRRCASRSI